MCVELGKGVVMGAVPWGSSEAGWGGPGPFLCVGACAYSFS